MPVLSIQYGGQIQTPNGAMALPASVVLAQRGPVIQVNISVHQSMSQQLIQQGVTLPPPVAGLALIDTGASTTCLDDGIAQQLQLPVVSTAQVATASHAAVQQNVYPVHIEVVGANIQLDALAMGGPLAAQGIQVLLGRDLLQHCVLHYNGTTGQISLAI